MYVQKCWPNYSQLDSSSDLKEKFTRGWLPSTNLILYYSSPLCFVVLKNPTNKMPFLTNLIHDSFATYNSIFTNMIHGSFATYEKSYRSKDLTDSL